MSLSIRKDIFNHIEISDNKGNKVNVERDIFGDLKFRSNSKKDVTLKKNIFDEREYSDSKGNKAKYSEEAWGGMMERYGEDEAIFKSLLNRYFGK